MKTEEREFLNDIVVDITSLRLMLKSIRRRDKISRKDIDILSKRGHSILFRVRYFYLTDFQKKIKKGGD